MRIVILAVLLCAIGLSQPVSADNQHPSVVNNVKAQGISGPAVIVSWDQPWDNVGVDGYNIYRDGRYYTTVRNTTNYIDNTISAGRNYSYEVVAFDRAHNYSPKSSSANASSNTPRSSNNAEVSAPPTSSGRPAPPANLNARVVSSSSITLSWSAPSGGAEGYNVYRDGHYYTTVKGRNNYTAQSLDSSRSYSFAVFAFRNNQYSIKSQSVSTRTTGISIASPPPVNDEPGSAIPNGYTLVFNDEFDRSSIDSSKWNTRYRWGPNWIINNEKQYYVDTLNDQNFGVNPFRFDGGNLSIRASKTPDSLHSKAKGQPYLSGAMTTHDKFRMTYGYVEIRAKLPKGRGLWPAFWLLHEANDRRKPEIDVMEMLGDDTRLIYQTYHYYSGGTLRSTPSYRAPGPDYSDAYHTFGMLWEPGRISWYVDGKKTNQYDSGNVSDESMYLLVNLALGGGWAGNPDGSTQFPADYSIDYIRAYQKR